jgi:hypothetical protein
MSEIIWVLVGLVPGLLIAFWFWRQDRSNVTPHLATPHKLPTLTISKVPGILVPISGKCFPEQAVKAGIELAKITGQTLYVVCFREIPRTRSLENCNDEELETSINITERVEREAHRTGIKIETNIAKVRNYSLGLVDTVLDIPVGLVILQPTTGNASVNLPTIASLAEAVHNKTGCNVLLVNPGLSTEAIVLPHMILQTEINTIKKSTNLHKA